MEGSIARWEHNGKWKLSRDFGQDVSMFLTGHQEHGGKDVFWGFCVLMLDWKKRTAQITTQRTLETSRIKTTVKRIRGIQPV